MVKNPWYSNTILTREVEGEAGSKLDPKDPPRAYFLQLGPDSESFHKLAK